MDTIVYYFEIIIGGYLYFLIYNLAVRIGVFEWHFVLPLYLWSDEEEERKFMKCCGVV